MIAAPSSAIPGASSLAHTFSRVDLVERDFKIWYINPIYFDNLIPNLSFVKSGVDFFGENIGTLQIPGDSSNDLLAVVG